jgi:hypothetical protein
MSLGCDHAVNGSEMNRLLGRGWMRLSLNSKFDAHYLNLGDHLLLIRNAAAARKLQLSGQCRAGLEVRAAAGLRCHACLER